MPVSRKSGTTAPCVKKWRSLSANQADSLLKSWGRLLCDPGGRVHTASLTPRPSPQTALGATPQSLCRAHAIGHLRAAHSCPPKRGSRPAPGVHHPYLLHAHGKVIVHPGAQRLQRVIAGHHLDAKQRRNRYAAFLRYRPLDDHHIGNAEPVRSHLQTQLRSPPHTPLVPMIAKNTLQ